MSSDDFDGPVYSAGHATYRGDCTHMVGEVKGPTTYGSYVVAHAAGYQPSTDTTRVMFRHLADGAA